jgi:hypothetical protein
MPVYYSCNIYSAISSLVFVPIYNTKNGFFLIFRYPILKLLLDSLRAIIFVTAIYFLMDLLFFCFGWGGAKAMIFLGEIKEEMNPFLFWALFIFFGTATLVILWILFKYLSIFVIALLVQICPYRTFAIWITIIIAIIYSCFFLYTYWFLHRSSLSFRDVMFGLILTAACMQLCLSFIRGVYASDEQQDKSYLK